MRSDKIRDSIMSVEQAQ